MAKTRQKKETEVSTLVGRLGKTRSVIFSSYTGLTVPEVTALRKELRGQGIEYQVVKKTLLERALSAVGLEHVTLKDIEGGIALAFSYEDEVLPAKLLDVYKKEHAAVVFQGGFVQGAFYTATQVQALAKLPSRTELLGSILGSLSAPSSNVVRVLAGPARALVQVLKAKSEERYNAKLS